MVLVHPEESRMEKQIEGFQISAQISGRIIDSFCRRCKKFERAGARNKAVHYHRALPFVLTGFFDDVEVEIYR